MDSGMAFLLGVLIGQWVMLFIIWRALERLIYLIDNPELRPGNAIIQYLPSERDGDPEL